MTGRCKDCDPEARPRKVTPPGPRCAEHHRARKALVKARAHGSGIAKYGITPDEYAALKASQGGKCYICQRATGATKNLAVDHDHDLGFGRHSVRALLCGPCNRELIGRYDEAALLRALEVIRPNPPAQRFLREVDRRRELEA